jgi:hypothetical protein
VVGGPGSGQVGEYFWASVVSGGLGPWNLGDDRPWCITGRGQGPRGGEFEYRFAIEFPLSDLPAGATIVRAVLSISALITAPTQSLYGYAGDGSISVADAVAGGPFVGFDAPVAGHQTVDVTSLVTPAGVTAGWAGFLQARVEAPGATWACLASGADYPRLTVEYKLP